MIILMMCAKLKNVMNEKVRIRALEEEDIKDLYAWRNHPDVRKHCFNVAPILWEEHEKWFNTKIMSKNTVIYIAFFEEQKLGSIRFENDNVCIKVSVMLNPDFWGKGLGSEVIKIGTSKFIKENDPQVPITAEIKIGNKASLSSFTNADFEAQYITCVYGGRRAKNE